jgi:3-phytase
MPFMLRLPRLILLALLLAVLTPAGAAAAAPAPTASAESETRFDDEAGGDADADDPGIWVHPWLPGRSVVVGTLKNAGLTAFDLEGTTLQDIPAPPAPGAPEDDNAAGRFNNVDVVYGVRGRGRPVDLAVVSDRGRDQIRFYAIDPLRALFGQAPLRDVTAPEPPLVFSASQEQVNDQTTAYGLAAWTDRRGRAFVVTSQRESDRLALLRVVPTAAGFTYERVDTLTLPSSFELPGAGVWEPCSDEDGVKPQVEGMVVDADRGLLFFAQETVGLWRVPVSAHGFGGDGELFERVREFGVPYDREFDPEEDEFTCELREDLPPGTAFAGEHLSSDAEGLTIYRGGRGRGHLIASSQGDDTFSVFADRGLGPHLGTFEIADGPVTDGVQESDGTQVVSTALGPRFPRGLFVTHDGEDEPGAPGRGDATNFKLVPWERVAAAFDPALLVEPRAWDPRR